MPILELPSGIHELIIRFYFGGFNFNYIEFDQIGVSVKDVDSEINEFSLEQNFPNPFNPTTNISYSISEKSFVNITLYDALGCKIFSLVSKEQLSGKYNIILDGSILSNGLYYISLKANEYQKTIKAVLLK